MRIENSYTGSRLTGEGNIKKTLVRSLLYVYLLCVESSLTKEE